VEELKENGMSDPVCYSEASSLIQIFFCTVLWYDILQGINKVNKLVQQEGVHLDVVVATVAIEQYRVSDFADAKKEAEELAVSSDRKIEFQEHRW
jgi:hypothetical protein